MRILITGCKGMLGRTLMRRLTDHDLTGTDLPELDLTTPGPVNDCISALRPDAVIHAAAFTAVDRCESEPELAYAANASASANLAVACHRFNARLIAIGTDYVFSGDLDRPYHEWDRPDPMTVYGQTKLAGEEAVRCHCPDHTILRIAWLYGPAGPSFLHTMLKLGGEKGDPLQVVMDQIGNPTSTDAVADAVQVIIDHPIPGVVHATCEGEASWYDLTRAIFEARGFSRGIEPCTSEVYQRPAPRPANSRLEKRAFRLAGCPAMMHWREALEKFFKEYPDA
jgi:dTDP-4-dehydrorhamnose reductase